MGSTWPIWVELDLCDGLGWIFFLVHHGGLGQKISSTDLTWLMHTPTGKCDIFFFAQFNNNSNKKKLSNSWVQPDPTRPMWVGLG